MMREAVEQIAWSIRTLIQQEYDLRINHQLLSRKNTRHVAIFCVAPILISYIIAHQPSSNSTNNNVSVSALGWLWNATIGGLAYFILNLWQAILRIVGITLGIGLGLGLAGHVYDVLSDAQVDGNATADYAERKNSSSNYSSSNTHNNNISKPNFPKDSSNLQMMMEDTNSYHSLMRSAGYNTTNVDSSMSHGLLLRAQMVRGEQAEEITKANDAKRESLLMVAQQQHQQGDHSSNNGQIRQHPKRSIYKFDKGTKASTQMKRMWPNLSPVINEALAKLTEFVLRDYVSCWYAGVDEHVVYNDPSSSTAAAAATTTTTSRVEGEECVIPSGSKESDNERPSTAPPAVMERRQTIATVTTPSSSDVSTINSSKGGVTDHLRSASERPHTFYSELQSSFTDPLLTTTLNSPYAVISPSNSMTNQPQQQRTMVLTTTGTQSSPFLDSLYTALAYLLGMVATRTSENVNILELLLLHFPHVLAQNLRVYREMKQVTLEKKRRRILLQREKWRRGQMEGICEVKGGGVGDLSGQFSASLGAVSASKNMNTPNNTDKELESTDVSEIAIIREYLLAGRLHSAITFGMDVPSLLFADPLGKDCPPGPSYYKRKDGGHNDEDEILDNRLLSPESSLIVECELDYNRVLASKIAKLVASKNEIESSVVRAMLVEMLASCVLTPTMGCFTPDYVNGWLITGLSLLKDGGTDGDTVPPPPASAKSEKYSEDALDTDSVGTENTDHRLDSIVNGVVEEIITSDGSLRSEMDETMFEEESVVDDNNCNRAEQIITLLSMSIIELGRFIDFEDCRHARERNEDILVDWDQPSCRKAVKRLVLVIEAALLLGARSERKRASASLSRMEKDDLSVMEQDDEFDVEVYETESIEKESTSATALPLGHQHASLSAALMELTGDIDAFEKFILDSEQDEGADDSSFDDDSPILFNIPKPNELSTLRTLIAAWLHTGQAFKVLSIIAHAKKSILVPFFHNSAFLRRENYSSDFVRLLRQLDGVEILVDTHAVLSSQCILGGNGFETLMQDFQKDFEQKQDDPFAEMRGRSIAKEPLFSHGLFGQQSVVGSMRAKSAQNLSRIARFAQSASESFHIPFDESSPGSSKRPFSANIAFLAQNNNHSTPAYLDFSKNSTFASSLRSERERRHESWLKEISGKDKIEFCCRVRGIKDKDAMLHRELHHLSRYFYSYTSEMRLEPCLMPNSQLNSLGLAANIIVKGVSSRRKLEVPDEDSSFLLRVQPKPLKPAAVHRDQRNPNLSCKIYFAMYEEPAIHPKTK